MYILIQNFGTDYNTIEVVNYTLDGETIVYIPTGQAEVREAVPIKNLKQYWSLSV
jgi:hypothetical protein